METLFTMVVSGFVAGLICMMYLVARNYYESEATLNDANQCLYENKRRVNWLSIILFSTGVSYGSCLMVAGVHILLENEFLGMGLLFALAVGMIAYLVPTMNKIGKAKTLTVWVVFILAVGAMGSLGSLSEN